MDDADRISFLGLRCPMNFRLRTVHLQPGDAIGYRPADWAATVVVVERGVLDIVCLGGERARFAEGSILVFAGLGVRRLGNASDGPLVLSALSRLRR